MQTIYELKEQAVTETPLLLIDCLFGDGHTEYWSTHRATVEGTVYAARILRHNTFEIQTASDQGVDGIPRISLTLANADSYASELERSRGFKGAKLTVRFIFYDLRMDEAASEGLVVFQGICNPPEEITEGALSVSATNRMSMQRVLLPQVRIQRRCPWNFPANRAQREEAADGGAQGKYSRFYRCGYSADVAGGTGSLDGEAPFTGCGYTREACQARGMFDRFGGIEFVPSTILVRSFGDKTSHSSPVTSNEARYNDFVPIIYGTAWYTPPIVFARNDGNLTRMEALLGMGEIQGVVKVLVNSVEIPLGRAGASMTGTGWYNVPTLGTRTGGFNLDFLDGTGQPAGDAYGSMAYLSLVVPSRLNSGQSLPTVQVLLRGLKLPIYDNSGNLIEDQFTSNPAWILLDVLRRSGWTEAEIDVASFATAAAYCDGQIEARDLYGNSLTIPRFQCNVAIQKRRSAADVIRGIRNAARLYLTYGAGGLIHLRVENTLELQQSSKPAGTNSTQMLQGGWPAYEFDDGTYGLSGILRRENGEPSFRVWSRSCTDTPNRLAVEFQDSLNEYQQDSFSLLDADDVARAGQEVSAPLSALGLPNYDQAARILKFNLDKSIRGNTYVQFDTSVKGFALRPGDLVAVTYLKEGFERQAFRVLKIAPGVNYSAARLTAQIHSDEWYADTNGQVTPTTGNSRENGAGIGLPKPILGSETDSNGDTQFGVSETVNNDSVSLSISFTAPREVTANAVRAPLLSLAAAISIGGTLAGGQTLYYAVSAVDQTGRESTLSFVVPATIPPGNEHSVQLTGLSFAAGTAAFHVYRGKTPAQLQRIASDQVPVSEFTDTGLLAGTATPPDPNFDHANFYWRRELQPESAATIHSATTIGNSSLEMAVNGYRGSVVRVTSGAGAGQERNVLANTSTSLTTAPPWDVEPDITSWFVIGEAGWKFGALSRTSPLQIEVPNRPGEIVQICGRAANVNDAECAAELSTVTRWTVGGSGTPGDSDVPPAPLFGMGPGPGAGTVEISGIAFSDLANTRTVTAGTLSLYYWSELQGQPAHAAGTATGAGDDFLDLSTAGAAEPGSFVQVEAEVMRVEERLNNGLRYRVARAQHQTSAAPHAAGVAVYHLASKTVVMPFPKSFFGTPYSSSWSYPIPLPDARVASATLILTNQRGNSDEGSANLTQAMNYGLRTLSGGQYTIQVDGFLAVDQAAAPALVVETAHAVNDVFAVLGKAADAPVELQLNVNDQPYCVLTVATGATISGAADGFTLPPLPPGGRVSLSILSVGTTQPGADLTVIIRL